ncbi:MAG TPA: hypothetical protein VFE36_09700 [Candidatus Baltobacteraceae bacterium]|jgi:hypothetical protein|nr:hypothetical protein [Candidatus Baltobacteraceae bacterium]
MNAASYGRFVFGASAVLFGVIGLMWHDAGTWQNLPILKLPAIVADVLAIAQIAGGIGMLLPRTVRPASIVLGVVYAIFCLACIPSIFAHPATYGSYVLFFEIFALVCGAFAIFAPPAARIGLGVSAVSFALAQLFYLKFTASLVPAWILPNQMFWAILTTVAFALAAIAILANVRARLALRLMTLMLALFGLMVWVPAVITHPEQHGNWSEFALNFLIMGAAGIVAELKQKSTA